LTEINPAERLSIPRLIVAPAVITLGVTVLRLVGELEHWSSRWFSAEPGGGGAIVGIVWLAPIFGVYFALKLVGAGEGPPSTGRAIGYAVLGLLALGGGFFLFQVVVKTFAGAVLMWTLSAAGAALQFPAWRAFFKVLLAYGYAARIPVAVVMFFATQRAWKSHYTALAFPTSTMRSLEQYVWFGLFPQLVWWVGFTVVTGSLCGCLAVAMTGRKRAASRAA
jgi:hypothetical protein